MLGLFKKEETKRRLVRVFEGKYLWIRAVLKEMEIKDYKLKLLPYNRDAVSQDYLLECYMTDYDFETLKSIIDDFMSPRELLIVAE